MKLQLVSPKNPMNKRALDLLREVLSRTKSKPAPENVSTDVAKIEARIKDIETHEGKFGAPFDDISFHGMDLSKLNLSAYRLHGTNLSNADFRNAFLVGVTLDYVDCCFTDFTGADLRGADIRKAFPLNSIYVGTDLRIPPSSIKLYTDSYIFAVHTFLINCAFLHTKITPEQKELFIRVTSGVLPPRFFNQARFQVVPWTNEDQKVVDSARFLI
ncbi:MAG: pentapeptide repeat-containing protein [Candidatus Micrarchaeota archaeon]